MIDFLNICQNCQKHTVEEIYCKECSVKIDKDNYNRITGKND